MLQLHLKKGNADEQRLVKPKLFGLCLPKQKLSFAHIEAKKKKELEDYFHGLCFNIWLACYKMSI